MSYYNDLLRCNFCGDDTGNNGSDLWTIDPSKWDYYVSYSGIYAGNTPFSGKCGPLWDIAMDPQGYLTKAQCPLIQEGMRQVCGCALRDATGKEIRGTGGSDYNPSPTPSPLSPTTRRPTPSPTPGNNNIGGQCAKLNGLCDNKECCSEYTCKKFGNNKSYCLKNRHLRGVEEEDTIKE